MLPTLSTEMLNQLPALNAVATATGHETYVHHVAVDLTSKFLATCSSDRCVRIYTRDAQCSDEDEAPPRWVLRSTIQEHCGTIHRVAWCHPDLGVHLASCGVDRRVNIYRVVTAVTASGEATLCPVQIAQSEGAEIGNTICDVAFCPPRQCAPDTLLFAVASLDGYVRLYDIDRNKKLSPKYGRTCPADDLKIAAKLWGAAVESLIPLLCAWPNPIWPSAGVVPTHGASTGHAAASPATGVGASLTVEPVRFRTSTVGISKPTAAAGLNAPVGVTAVAWLASTTELTPTLAVGTAEGIFDVYVLLRKDRKTFRVPSTYKHPLWAHSFPQLRLGSAVTCIAWAPRLGRDYELIAVGSRRGTVIVRVHRVPTETAPTNLALEGEVFVSPLSCVSASWDATATILLVTSDMDDTTSPHLRSSRGSTILHQKIRSDHQSWEATSSL